MKLAEQQPHGECCECVCQKVRKGVRPVSSLNTRSATAAGGEMPPILFCMAAERVICLAHVMSPAYILSDQPGQGMYAMQLRRADILGHPHFCSPHMLAAQVWVLKDVSSTQLHAYLSSKVAPASRPEPLLHILGGARTDLQSCKLWLLAALKSSVPACSGAYAWSSSLCCKQACPQGLVSVMLRGELAAASASPHRVRTAASPLWPAWHGTRIPGGPLWSLPDKAHSHSKVPL